jgi:hypothetical protein
MEASDRSAQQTTLRAEGSLIFLGGSRQLLQEYIRLAVYVPIEESDAGKSSRIAYADPVQAVLDAFRMFEFAGMVGTYRMVAELSGGAETFMPTENSTPAHGRAGNASVVASVRVVTYIPASTSREKVDRMVDQVVAKHPWEHPVIEVDRVCLWIPS